MTDRDVGELWQAVMYASNTPMNKLIRKLVEERAEKYWQASPDSQLRTRLPAEGIIEALDDFGIDPKTWEAKP